MDRFWELVEEDNFSEIRANRDTRKILDDMTIVIHNKLRERMGCEIKLDEDTRRVIEKIISHGREHIDELTKGYSGGHEETSEFMMKRYPGTLLETVDSKYQSISVYDTNCGRILVIDCDLQFITKDEYIYHEMFVHVPLMMLPNAKRALVIGAGDGGVCREILKHNNVSEIIQVEIDSEVVRLCKKYFPDMARSMDDDRVTMVYEDASRWVKTISKDPNYVRGFDVIIMDTTDFNRSDSIFTPDFFNNVKTLMNDRSLIVMNGGCLSWYTDLMDGVMTQVGEEFRYARIYQVHLPMYGDGHYGFVICSNYKDPKEWVVRHKDFIDKDIRTRYYTPWLHAASFELPRDKDRRYYDDDIMNHRSLGSHITIDFKCRPNYAGVLDDMDEMRTIFDKITKDFDMKVVGESEHKFSPQGLTLCYLLSESHISVHTWPEHNSACMDIFSCNPNFDPNRVSTRILSYFCPDDYKINYVDRSI